MRSGLGPLHNPRLMDYRMVYRGSADAAGARRHPRASFVERRGDEAIAMWARPEARKNFVRAQNPAIWIIPGLAIDRPHRHQGASYAPCHCETANYVRKPDADYTKPSVDYLTFQFDIVHFADSERR